MNLNVILKIDPCIGVYTVKEELKPCFIKYEGLPVFS